ncbi:peptidylprolyl isomerase PpiC [Pantoea ananatis]|uniref:peptidylprolyl isomerase PpiC n=1 Tax=Pantoea ananas TaxID=553 RepID=UPI00024170CA|nr:peptidylprolyl isomerase PpiC [Pantoea ananatis]KNA26977.1 peptidylprolyl isomerase [Pantoea ananatis]MDJ0033701.1 peptidylprolyl isomerase PpiC [Pantoea ananatis]MDJ0044367.1 peptidylprolyl isomerase PpiC [Pantoea ananatis]PVY83625.1 peptidyl-prolyl cis-trans isomerase C [Pantoea ananatis]CCF11677.1 PpiC-type peptidyl-prolyl cis-trans isomerase [Pantoea ananatis LMG 5342]
MAKTAAALHILVKHEAQAIALLEKLQKGENFQQLARKHSVCPSGRNGGDLGEFRRGKMVATFDKAAFTCPLLQPFGPVKTAFGYHIIKVLYRN